MSTKKKKDEEESEKDVAPSSEEDISLDEFPIMVIPPSEEPFVMRKVGLYGHIDEEKCAEAVYHLLTFYEKSRSTTDSEDAPEPVELVLSTWGGSAADMFAVYDTMRLVGNQMEIETLGLGKVMSAGVLLLAAGTKGKRRVGRHCRIMLHSVVSGHSGELFNLENELEEAQHTQTSYIKALAQETDMTEKYIKKLLGKKINVYLTAEEAVELGIADEVI